MVIISGESYECIGTRVVPRKLLSGSSVSANVIAVHSEPLNFEFILEMNGATALHGVTVRSPNDVKFAIDKTLDQVVAAATLRNSNEKDFTVVYNSSKGRWTMVWKWCNGTGLLQLFNTISEYKVPEDARQEYDSELP